MKTNGEKLKKALKSAAKLPAKAVIKGSKGAVGVGRGIRVRGAGVVQRGIRGSRRALSPLPGETPLVVLKIQVVSCSSLLPKDRNGSSDPFVTVSHLQAKHNTPTLKRTLNPIFPPKESTFEFPIYLSVVDRMGGGGGGVGAVELVVWDRDMILKKEYLGEASVLGVDGWFQGGGGVGWDDPTNKPFSIPLASTRADTPPTGSVQIKVGLVSPPGTASLLDLGEVVTELRKRHVESATMTASWVSAPPTQGVGTIRSHTSEGQPQAGYEDDGGLSSADEYDDGEESDQGSEGAGSEAEGELAELDSELALEEAPSSSSSPAAKSSPKGPQIPPKLAILQQSGTAQFESPTTPTAGSTVPTARMPSSLAQTLTPPTPRPKDQLQVETQENKPAMTTISAPPSPAPQQVTTTISKSGFIPKMKFTRKKTSSPPVSPTASSTGSEEKKTKDKKSMFKKRWSTGSSSSPSNAATSPVPPATPPVPPVVPSQPPTPASEVESSLLGIPSGNETPASSAPPAATTNVTSAFVKKKKKDFQFEAGNDIVGIVMLEIVSAEDLPKLKNVTRTGFDMDPFVVISFGKKVFRTRVIRHSLNPVWDEKLLFHVRQYETAYRVQLTILDWDKLSSNDLIGDASFDVKALVETSPQPDPVTGLYAPDYGGDHPMNEMKLDLNLEKDIGWEAQGAKPRITIRAKYQSYAALRQRFWRQYLKQYDVDDTCTIDQLELTSMLDSLGSTLTKSTIESFYERFGQKPDMGELTVDQTIQCLESELGKPVSERKRIDISEEPRSSASATPILTVMDKMGKEFGSDMSLSLEGLDFSGRPAHAHPEYHRMLGSGTLSGFFGDQHKIVAPQYTTEPNQMPLPVHVMESAEPSEEEESGASSANSSSNPGTLGARKAVTDTEMTAQPKKSRFRRIRRKKKAAAEANTEGSDMVPFERVINVKNCPLCHRPRLNSKAEVDIVTHLAVCASQDWNQVDRIVVGNFVTASQAQRKWYTNIWEKISAGDYRVGANSANIIVQNRITGQLEEEKMQVYVRLGIRLLYKGASGRMESARARRLLKSLSIKQGIKYDSPESANEIPAFVQFHQLNVSEILEPLHSFKTFNQFFYRKLKLDARPVENPDDPYRLVSPADCRLMTFESVTEATKIWIKGRDFSVGRLLGEAYKDEVDNYVGGALGIFRLAPQDYHRFHSPVDGTIGPMTYIAGEYYTVNPQAIRTSLDVYGENARKIVPIDSPQFGRVMAVCVGAMMVGTIKTTVEEGQQVRRGQEFGYFAFGGSTIVLLMKKGVLEWDEDLLVNGRASLETLVRVGMGIGNGRRPISC